MRCSITHRGAILELVMSRRASVLLWLVIPRSTVPAAKTRSLVHHAKRKQPVLHLYAFALRREVFHMYLSSILFSVQLQHPGQQAEQ